MVDHSQTGPALAVRDLTKVFETPGSRVTALDAVSLSVPRGEIHGIVGRSGAGKSTLIRCLTGLELPTSGEVVVAGEDITRLRGAELRAARRRFGVVYQHANLLDSRTAADNIALPLEVAGWDRGDRDARVAELLDLVGLSDRAQSHPGQLSGGQQQRVGIARALAARPEILLCDEPTSALDAATTGSILALLRELRDRLGITVVIITHEPSVVREICDAVTLLGDGAVLEQGRLGEVIADPSTRLHRELIPLVEPESDGLVRLQVALGHPDATVGSIDGIIALLRHEGIEADLAAATVETIAGRRVGRLLVELADASTTERARDLLDQARLHPEVAA
ncbi:methionine ABC transporter ATP-binding protein [Knoellia sp. Soil729]|uniref:methionine ABC transporter ATP-binding protein n=1 Tax=Knoellia sp. Soil729 TaxID=1736394 RepID=UPI0007022CFF|nr:ATP-binding cassette domain-containing protein [Knoellia sp. Soil729]KRE42842.1 methionine ABC transporter ATP-binding protein [Knoellia sp. Soil729]